MKMNFNMTDIEITLAACPGMDIEDAREMLVARSRSEKKIAERASRIMKPEDIRREFKSHTFVKPSKRITSESADHTSRLSSSRKDSKAMREFLKNGGTITVVPTKNSKGFKSQKIKVGSAMAPQRSCAKQRAAHTKQARNAKSLRS